MSPLAQCVLDRALINAETLPFVEDVGVSIFASACSKNRGAFVLDPPNGVTYGCLALPEGLLFEDILNVPAAAAAEDTTNATIPSDFFPFDLLKVEDITSNYAGGNLTAQETVEMLDFLVERVYASTPEPDQSPYACDVNGLVTLENCPSPAAKKKGKHGKSERMTADADLYPQPIRATTIAGVFAPADWATGNASAPDKIHLTQRDAEFFYVPKDFDEMFHMGLNTVQFPVSLQLFSVLPKVPQAFLNLLTKWLHYTYSHHMKAIVRLENHMDEDGLPAAYLETVGKALTFCNGINLQHNDTVVMAVILPDASPEVMLAAADVGTSIPLWLPAQEGDLIHAHAIATAIPGVEISAIALDLSHTSTIAEIASSTAEEDRSKLVFHETMACLKRAPLEYTSCYQNLPVFVSSGFDLAIDNCHMLRVYKHFDMEDEFPDYGQCDQDRFKATVHSPWWHRHRRSFAARQIAAYEKGGLGWAFATWKVFRVGKEKKGVIDVPAKLLSLQDVSANGLIPSLIEKKENRTMAWINETGSWPLDLACLNPPANDFVMGDKTLAPTMGPPPDCGDGWWNFTTEKCDYWIPPPFNFTACPNTTVIYECPMDDSTNEKDGSTSAIPADEEENIVRQPIHRVRIFVHGMIAGAGVLLALLVIGYLVIFKYHRSRYYQYQVIPPALITGDNGYQEYHHHSSHSLNSMESAERKPKPLRK
jgi:hypothetical protein